MKTYMRPVLKILKIVIIITLLIELFLLLDAIIKNDYINFIFANFLLVFILFVAIFSYWSESNGKIEVDDKSVTFYYHLFSKHKGYKGFNFKTGLQVKFDDVERFEITNNPGMFLISAGHDTYYIKLTSGIDFTFYLFHFGKQETEIREHIINCLKDKMI